MGVYILYAILGVASVWDLRTFKIPNALSIIGILLGIVWTLYDKGFSLETLWIILAVVGIFFTFLPAWMFFGMGAGDVKLLMVVAAFVGYTTTLRVGMDAIFMASFIFLFLIPWSQLIQAFRSYLYLLFYKISIVSNRVEKKKIPFAIIILMASILELHILV